ncbi:MAG: S8 family peptidase [Acidobacteriota bacterium]
MTEYRLVKQENVLKDLDPHLQRLILDDRAGRPLQAGSSCVVADAEGRPRAEVVAWLHKPRQKVEGLTIGRRIGQIATGTVAVEDIERVRRQVKSLKAARTVRPALGVSVPEIHADRASLHAAFPNLDPVLDGTGVIVGVVDADCDFTHPNFLRAADDRTRLLFLWDQRGPQTAASPAGYPYGRELDSARLNESLSTLAPFLTARYRPDAKGHGTHVMDVAAGNGRAGSPGVAPGADLIFVHVDTGVSKTKPAGNSLRLLDAVEYVFAKAEELGRPAVVNVSLAEQTGPHDGSFPVEQGFERLLKKPGRSIVIAAGNSFDRRAHTLQTVRLGDPVRLAWRIPNQDTTPNEMEIWYEEGSRLEVSLVSPTGQELGPVRLGETHTIESGDGQRQGTVIQREKDPNNDDNVISLFLDTTMDPGIWTVVLVNPNPQPVEIHAWIESDATGTALFESQSTSMHTLSSIACGTRPIVVGAYDASDPQRPLMPFSSSGPTRDGRSKPDLSAPGEPVQAARVLGGVTSMDGTSVAAPHVTGLAALLFQAAGPVTNGRIKQALQASARSNPPANPPVRRRRYGQGCVDGVGALQRIAQPAPGGGIAIGLPTIPPMPPVPSIPSVPSIPPAAPAPGAVPGP